MEKGPSGRLHLNQANAATGGDQDTGRTQGMAASSVCSHIRDRAMPAIPRPASSMPVGPRVAWTKLHRLVDILKVTLCGVLCGAENWVEIADWADAKRARLTEWLGLDCGIPSHDTLSRVFDRLNPVQFETGFLHWVQGTLTPQVTQEVIASDGKMVRRSGTRAPDVPLAADRLGSDDRRHGLPAHDRPGDVDPHCGRPGAHHHAPALPQQLAGRCPPNRRGGPQPLGDREWTALGARCRVPGERQPDARRVQRRKPGPIRKLALNLLRLEPTRKHGIKASRLWTGRDHDDQLRVLGAV